MSQSKIRFIDANVIMYSAGGPHPLRNACKGVVEKIRSGKFSVVTNTEVLQEILHRYFSIRKPVLGEIVYQSMAQVCVEVLPVTRAETDKALDILKTYEVTSRDAIHAATMINNGVREILSADPHFDLIREIKRIDPLSIK